MTVTIDKIGWSQYSSYEGPFFGGTQPFKMPARPDEADRHLAVITAAEGGHYDAINMYDRGIISVGIIQWIESGQYSVSGMFGEVANKAGLDAVMVPLKPALDLVKATFKKNSRGQWRFFFLDERGEVDNLEKTRALFLGCSGLKGSWTPEAKIQAKTWAACAANVWSTDAARRAQTTFTRDRLRGFIFADAKSILFGSEPNDGWVGAVRATFMSFAINLPTVANAQVKLAASTLKSPKWSAEWCIGVIKQMTLGPNISIYHHRYNSIRPVLESLWGIKLPRTTKELAAWSEPEPVVVKPPTIPDLPVPTPQPEQPKPPTVQPEPEIRVEPPPQPEPTPEPTPGPEPVQPIPPEPAPIIPSPPPGPTGVLGFILWLLQTIFSMFTKRKTQ